METKLSVRSIVSPHPFAPKLRITLLLMGYSFLICFHLQSHPDRWIAAPKAIAPTGWQIHSRKVTHMDIKILGPDCRVAASPAQQA